MKKLLVPIICLICILIVLLSADKITDHLIFFLNQKTTNKIEIKNDYIRHHADSICDIINDLALNHCDDRAM